jgi:DNA-binding Lrp family transcriptional regulator
MELSDADRRLIAAIAEGLPLEPRPYAAIARRRSAKRRDRRLRRLTDAASSALRRDRASPRARLPRQRQSLGRAARRGGGGPPPRRPAFVSLCYRRPRRHSWPYNLFCAILARPRRRQALIDLATAELAGRAAARRVVQPAAVPNSGARYAPPPRAARASGRLDAVDRRLINACERFPLCERPYAAAAADFGLSETELIERLGRLLDEGVLSRFGPLYDAERLGGGVTLAAMQVPEDRFEAVAEIVNGFAEVAHNYARDHALNMWFVVAAARPERVGEVLAEIEAATGLAVLVPKMGFFLKLRLDA